jgi:outer membrane protein assembly factor BamE (lipoprotein component of BamABCDE complex)
MDDPVSFILIVLFGVLGIFMIVKIAKAASRTVEKEQKERGAIVKEVKGQKKCLTPFLPAMSRPRWWVLSNQFLVLICKRILIAVIVALLTMLVSCSRMHQRQGAQVLHAGMSRAQVIEALGDPDSALTCDASGCQHWPLQERKLDPANWQPSCLVYNQGPNQAMAVTFDRSGIARQATFTFNGPKKNDAAGLGATEIWRGMMDNFTIEFPQGSEEYKIIQYKSYPD